MLNIKDVLEATGGRVISGNSGAFSGVSIDSRTIRNGELFVALKGQNFDGHDFLEAALEKGGGALVSAQPATVFKGKCVIYVRDTLRAMQDLARYERLRRKVIVIGVTGTNGKTTTKELIASVLGVRHSVLKSSGNLNNQIGLPLSLLRVRDKDEFAVMEMGASFRGDIKELCEIARPDYGVITNIGPGHLEGFGSLEMVRNTKLELFEAVKTTVLNADDEFLMQGVSGKGQQNIITFGLENPADVYARDIRLEEGRSVFTLCLGGKKNIEMTLNVNGSFNIYNALAAAAVCDALGTEPADIKKGLEAFAGVPMRLELKTIRGATVISDVYNANPASMEEALKELARLRKKRAIAVLGDMLELGLYAEEAHRRLGVRMSGLKVDIFIAAGPMMSKAAEEFSKKNNRGMVVSDAVEAGRLLSEIAAEGDTILVKGSRGMNMDLAVDMLVNGVKAEGRA